MTRRAPRSSIPRPSHASALVHIDATDDQSFIRAAMLEPLHAVPTFALDHSDDPTTYIWPVAQSNVAIRGCLPLPRLKRLMAALMRDGALCVAGLDMDNELHTAVQQRRLRIAA
jgi:hypothetical protein